jgi:hypothetical protein
MGFFNPWLLLGALALAAPLWLHLRRKEARNLIQFSALRFLDDQPEPRRAPYRLRDLLLLALRALALLLLVAAFAWPYLRSPEQAPIQESRVYILDNTLSHQANGRFSQDRDRVAGEVRKAGHDVQVAVVELTSNPRVVAGFGDNRVRAVENIKALQPSFQRGSYLAAFRQAGALLANSLGERKRIIFFGDNQENQWSENGNTPPFLRDVQVEFAETAGPALPNLSLAEARAQRIFLGDKSLVNFTVKLRHIGEAKEANVVLRANNQGIINRTVNLEGQPETILLQAQWEADPAAWLQGDATVDGTPDALAGDNRVFFCLAPVVEGKVALLAQSPYLRLALSPEIMRGQWAARIIEPSRLSAELETNQDADVLCLESSFLQSGDARKLLHRYLSNGRGVLLLVNRVTPAIAGCLRELGFEADGPVKTGKADPERFQFVFSNHQIFHPFLSPDYGNLMDIKVLKYFRLKGAQAVPLVFSERGTGLFFEAPRTQGRLFVAAFGMDREHTSWPVHQTFIPFLDLTLQAARAEDPTPISFEPGQTGLFPLPASTQVRELVLRSGGRECARAPVTQGHAEVRLPDQPGLYTITYDENKEIEKMVSVNPSPKESELSYLDGADTLKIWQMPRAVSPPKYAAAASQARIPVGAILQQRYWWWMVLAGVGVLMLEMGLVSARKERA